MPIVNSAVWGGIDISPDEIELEIHDQANMCIARFILFLKNGTRSKEFLLLFGLTSMQPNYDAVGNAGS